MMSALQTLIVRHLAQQAYQPCWQGMKTFTQQRTADTVDEIWLLEHPPIFTLGQSASTEHILRRGNIPVLAIDRGGQVTYHGPGQLIAYTLLDLNRKGFAIRQLVTKLEQAVIDLLAEEGIHAEAKCKAPGVYVNDKKICSIGLRIRQGYSFHGLALNVDMDLSPFKDINPCGLPNLEMTQLADLKSFIDMSTVKTQLIQALMNQLGYDQKVENYEKPAAYQE